MKTLTIVITIYNIEKYIEKCLQSLILQTDKHFKVILVNDGSSDKSMEIVNKYQNNFENLTIINQENEGLSSARNASIKHINTSCFIFLDGDDYLDPNAVEIIKREWDNDLSLMRFQLKTIQDDQIIHSKSVKFDTDKGVVVLPQLIKNTYFEAATLYVYNTLFYKENMFIFPKGFYHEDYALIPKIIVKAEKVKYISDELYNYVKRNNSITNKRDKINILKKYNDVKYIYYQYIKEFYDIEFINKNILMSYLTYGLLYKLVTLPNNEYKKELKNLRKDGIFNNILDINWKYRIKRSLIKFSPKWMCR